MRRPLPKVRYISPASIEIGDTIRVTTKDADAELTCTGKVAKREYDHSFSVFLTAKGVELFRWHPSHDGEHRVTLLDRAPAAQVPLF